MNSRIASPGAKAWHAAQPPAACHAAYWSPRALLTAIGLVALVVGAYLPAFSAGFVWDDDVHVTANSTLRTADGLRRIWCEFGSTPQYYPLVHTTFWLEYHLWGIEPVGYHVTNVVLHALAVVLLWLVLKRLQLPGAVLAAAIFAVHPIEVESVAWVSERKNVLSLMFALAALAAYLRFCGLPSASEFEKNAKRWRWYAAALTFFAAAMLGKTVVASLPAVLLVIIWWQRGRVIRRDVWPLIPLFLVGAALSSITIVMERHIVGARGDEWDLTVVERLLVAGRSLWFYVAKLAWPERLTFTYPRFALDASQWWQHLFPAATIGLLVILWRARGIVGRGPLAAVLIFAGVLLPALGFFDIYPFRFSFVADHFQYHAGAPLIALAAAAGTMAWQRWGPGGQLGGRVAAVALLATLVGLTGRQARIYRDGETLYRDTTAKNPAGWMAYANLGVHCDNLGRWDEAHALYSRALELSPRDAANLINMAGIVLKLGNRDGFAPGQLDTAISQLKDALALESWRPEVHERLGQALLLAGEIDESVAHYEQALALRPDFTDVHNDLGVALSRQGRLQDAISHFEQAARSRPDSLDIRANLVFAYVQAGRPAVAASAAEETLRLAGVQGQSAQSQRVEAWLTAYRQGRIGR